MQNSPLLRINRTTKQKRKHIGAAVTAMSFSILINYRDCVLEFPFTFSLVSTTHMDPLSIGTTKTEQNHLLH